MDPKQAILSGVFSPPPWHVWLLWGLIVLLGGAPAGLSRAAESPWCAYHFDGKSQRIELPSMNLPPGGVTLEAWIQLDYLPAEMNTNFAGFFDADQDGFVLYLDQKTNELRFKVTTVNRAYERPGAPGASLTKNGWLHVAGLFDPEVGMASLYLNGFIEDWHVNEAMKRQKVTAQTPAIGCNYNSNQCQSFFPGRVAAVRIWNRPLPVEELLDAMHHVFPTNRAQAGLYADYRFESGGADMAPDYSGNGLHGRVVGQPPCEPCAVPLAVLQPGFDHHIRGAWNVRPFSVRPEASGLNVALVGPQAGDYVVYGTDAATGVTTNDALPGSTRALRTWQVVTPRPVVATLNFNRGGMGGEALKVDSLALLYRPSHAGAFQVVTEQGRMEGDEVRFDAITLTNGFYSLGGKNIYPTHYYGANGQHVFPYATPQQAATNIMDALKAASKGDAVIEASAASAP